MLSAEAGVYVRLAQGSVWTGVGAPMVCFGSDFVFRIAWSFENVRFGVAGAYSGRCSHENNGS